MTQETKEFNVEGRGVCIAVPGYTGKVSFNWLEAYVNTGRLARKCGVQVGLQTLVGSSLIANSRSELAHNFLYREDMQHLDTLMFIDDDVVWQPEDFLKLVALTTEFDMLAGVYCTKSQTSRFIAELKLDENKKPIFNEYGLIKARTCPGGFLMIRRHALKAMSEFYKDKLTIIHKPDINDQNKEHEMVHLWHMPLDAENKRALGEDIAFCLRWENFGGELWLDPEVHLIHEGYMGYDYQFKDAIGRQFFGENK